MNIISVLLPHGSRRRNYIKRLLSAYKLNKSGIKIKARPYEPAPQHTQNTDIIICVHNAYDDVKACIESVLNYTSQPYNIIIVDDGSSKQTRDYLQRTADENPDLVTLIRNNPGRGYAIAANIGLRASKAEYRILLNSDTIVTAGWLDKMIRCQRDGDNIGMAGPLSNTASWQSVPKIDDNGDWARNEIPQELGLQQYAALIERKSSRLYPQVPLLNGFCLMFHKSVIDAIGFFDEEVFGSGFGEEDDYCIRAGKAGFRLAIADDTFIYHAQSKSFTDEVRHKYYKINGAKLREKHGDELIDRYVQEIVSNPYLQHIRASVSAICAR